MDNFEPRIVAFLCNWGPYPGADVSGTASMKSVSNVRAVRTMCSGRVDPGFVLKAFALGADGVLVLGCHPGDCHYYEGNYLAARRLLLLKRLLTQLGIEEDRLRLDWLSAIEEERFVSIATEMTETVRALGPLARSQEGQ